MASIATAVLPVWRSPIINSRCPRPIGTKASIAFKPVCIGSWTDLRGIIPGLWLQHGWNWVVSKGSLPSIGLPRASTTRPSNSFQQEPEQFRQSAWRCRLLIARSFPKITTPTLSAFRVQRHPFVPSGNSTISPARTLSRPYISGNTITETDKTCPISATSAIAPKLAICLSKFQKFLLHGYPYYPHLFQWCVLIGIPKSWNFSSVIILI